MVKAKGEMLGPTVDNIAREWERFNVLMHDLKETFGKELISALNNFLGVLKSLTEVLGSVGISFSKNIVDAGIAAGIVAITFAVEKLAKALLMAEMRVKALRIGLTFSLSEVLLYGIDKFQESSTLKKQIADLQHFQKVAPDISKLDIKNLKKIKEQTGIEDTATLAQLF